MSSSTPIIGREAESQRLLTALCERGRRVAIIGIPGIGKSALAHHIAEVAEVRLGAVVPVLDEPSSLENVPERCVIAATTRPSVANLYTLRLGGLGNVSTRHDDPAEDAGIRFFIDRCEAVGVHPEEDDLLVMARIVDLLDGVPLAIELAAERCAVMSFDRLAERLEESLTVLTASLDGGGFDQVLKTLLETLPRDTRLTAQQLGIFTGTFDVEQAEQVIHLEQGNALDALQTLRDTALLHSSADRNRLTLLAPVRDFVRRHPDEDADLDGARLRHARVFADRGGWCMVEYYSRPLSEITAELARIQTDLRAAWDWLDDEIEDHPERHTVYAEVCRSLAHSEGLFPPFDQCIIRLKRALKVLSLETPGVPSVLYELARKEQMTGNRDSAEDYATKLVAESPCESRMDRIAHCRGYRILASLRSREDSAISYAYLQSAEDVLEGATDLEHERAALNSTRARVAYKTGDVRVALQASDRAVALFANSRASALYDAWLMRALCLMMSGQAVDALIAIRRSEALVDTPDTQPQLALVRRHRTSIELVLGDGTVHVDLDELRTSVEGMGWMEPEVLWVSGVAALLNRRPEVARQHLLHCVRHANAQQEPLSETLARVELAGMALDVNDPKTALEVLDAMDEDASDAVNMRPYLVARRAWCQAAAKSPETPGTIALAEELLERPLAGNAHVAPQTDLVLARRALDALDDAAACSHLISLLTPQIGGGQAVQIHVWVRLAARRLAASLPRAELRRAFAAAFGEGRLLIDRESAVHHLPDGKTLDLSRKDLLQRLLLAVVDSDAPLDAFDMIAAGWPGESIQPDAATNRLYKALSTLRKLGAGELIGHTDDGYCLREGVEVVEVTTLI